MAHFAQLDENNIVLQVLVVNNDCICDENGQESEHLGCEFLCGLLGQDTVWKQCSYNGNFRGNYPGIGFEYLPDTDVFIGKKPFPSWILNREEGIYYAPIDPPAYNSETHYVSWDEENLSWIVMEIEPLPLEADTPAPDQQIDDN